MGVTGITKVRLDNALEKVRKLVDVSGHTVKLLGPTDEADPLDMDEFGELIDETPGVTTLKVWPVRTSPFSRKVIASIGWADEVDIIMYAARKAVDNLNLTIEDLKAKTTAEYDGREYHLSRVERHMASAADVYLYYILGLASPKQQA